MSIVRALIEKMGGKIEVQSAPDVGTTYVFQLEFKLDKEAKTTKYTSNYATSNNSTDNCSSADNSHNLAESGLTSYNSPQSESLPLTGIHILLVEDNDINMEIAEFYLTDNGATVEKAWNGQDAVEKFADSAPGTYQLILMDVMMPVMDGFEATRQIRSLFASASRPDAASIPILAMTAQTSAQSIQECKNAGNKTVFFF